jgi:hypothetical protein
VNLAPRKVAGEISEGRLFDIGYADEITPVLAQPEKPVPNGIGIMPWSPLKHSFLSGKFRRENAGSIDTKRTAMGVPSETDSRAPRSTGTPRPRHPCCRPAQIATEQYADRM